MTSRLENEKAHGRRIAGHAEEIWNWSGPAGSLRWARRVRFILDRLGARSRILEVGCGTGLLTEALLAPFRELHAIDISGDLLGKARDRVGGAAHVTLSIQNAYSTGFREEVFDAVVGISVLHHLEIEAALREFVRLLKPGGALLFSEPNMANPIILLQKNIPLLKRLAGDSPDETAFVRGSLGTRLANAGFKDIRIVPFDFLHPSTPRVAVAAMDRLSHFLEGVPVVREIGGSLLVEARKPGRKVGP